MKIKIGKNKYWKPMTFLKNLLMLLFILYLLWSTVSYIEILINNTNIHPNGYPELSYWNFWGILGNL